MRDLCFDPFQRTEDGVTAKEAKPDRLLRTGPCQESSNDPIGSPRVVFAGWRDYYNNIRPHRPLGLQSPSQFARNHSTQGLGSGRPTDSLRPSLPENQHQPTETVS